MSDIEGKKRLAKTLVDAMNRSNTQWFLDNYADDVLVWTMGNTMISGKCSKDQAARVAVIAGRVKLGTPLAPERKSQR